MAVVNEFGKALSIIGNNIRKIRIKKGMTQKALAEACDFEAPNMRRIEAGKTNPTVKTLLKISSILETDIRYFFKHVKDISLKDL